MKALFFAILRASLVIMIGVIASAAVAFWLFSGKTPTSIKGLQDAAKDLASFHQIKKQMVERSYNDAESIKDDFDQPAGVNAETIAAAEAEAADLAKLNAEIAEAQKAGLQEQGQIQQKEIQLMKYKLTRLQSQLDRIENQNRALHLKISKLIKDGKN